MKNTLIPREIRKVIYDLHKEAKTSHIGSSLSCVEILLAIKRTMEEGDEFILSKGHAISCWYAISGVSDMAGLPRHATRGCHISFSSGSLGHGLSIACGWALANRDKKIYVVLGDGECQEGQVWEALMFAAHHKLTNLYAFIDNNTLQGCGRVKQICKLDLEKQISSFGWNTRGLYGHDLTELEFTLKTVKNTKRPVCFICYTTKGKGFVKFEDNNLYHYKYPE